MNHENKLFRLSMQKPCLHGRAGSLVSVDGLAVQLGSGAEG